MRFSAALLALLCLPTAASATSYTHIPSMDEVVDDSTVAVHAIVAGTQNCNADRAWTFVDLTINDVLRGSVSLPAPGSNFRIRMPYGVYPDGTVGTFVDTPALEVGDEVVLFLTYENGEHPLVPISWMGWSVYRVFRSEGGATAVVSGFGQPVLKSTFGPYRDHGYKELRALYYTDPDLDMTAVANTLTDIAQNANWTGQGHAAGPWRGHIRIELEGGGETSTCEATLTGTLAPNGTFSAVGGCNADWAGAVEVTVDGTRSQGVYTGTVTVSPTSMPQESRTVNWSSSNVFLDHFDGGASGTHTEQGYTLNYDIDLRAVYTGTRSLASFPDFKNWVTNTSTKYPANEGVGVSLPLGQTSCDVTIPVMMGVQ